VPVILIDDQRFQLREHGSLRDIAPTVIGILGLRKPEQMTGHDLRMEE
jgi:2,3-bisphosphoglycerate-independent phosphoglycerate mutase